MARDLDCMTDEIQQLLAEAAWKTNRHIASLLEDKGHIFAHMTPLQKAQEVRNWYICYVRELLSGFDDIISRTPRNIDGLQIGEEYFLSFRKIPSPNFVPDETPSLRIARLERALFSENPQLALPDFDLASLQETIRELPLYDLKHLTIGYWTKENMMVLLFVSDVDFVNEQVLDYIEIDIPDDAQAAATEIIPLQPTSPSNGSSRLKFVPKKREEEDTA